MTVSQLIDALTGLDAPQAEVVHLSLIDFESAEAALFDVDAIAYDRDTNTVELG